MSAFMYDEQFSLNNYTFESWNVIAYSYFKTTRHKLEVFIKKKKTFKNN